jgi:hypothetical protein
VPVLPPGPDILLSGDVERNPGPHPFPRQLGVIEDTIDDIEGMTQWQEDKVQERLDEANRHQVYPHYPLVLYGGDYETEDFQTTYQHEEPAYLREAMTNLAVLSEVAEPSFLLMINRLETSFEKKDNFEKLHEYGPVAMHLISCLMSIKDVSQEQSLHMMLMTCIQRKMEQLHERDFRSTASLVFQRKMTSSKYLADVVRRGATGCDVVRRCAAWCDVVRRGATWCDVVRLGLMQGS